MVSIWFEPRRKKIYRKVRTRHTQLGFNVSDLEGFHALAEMLFGTFKTTCCKSKCAEVYGYAGIIWDEILGVLKEPYSA